MATTKTAVKLPKSNTPKKNSKTRLRRSVDFKSRKTQLITFLIAIVVLGGGFFIYRSFAAVTLVGADGEFTPINPASRILDTRNGTGGVSTAVATKQTVKIKVAGAGGIPASNISAVTINVTAVSPTANGYLKVGAAGAAESAASTINFTAKESITNSINVQVSADGYVQVTNYAGNTHVVFDVAGYYSKAGGAKGLRLKTIAPKRIDTREALAAGVTTLAPNQVIKVKVAGVGGIPAQGARAVIMNVVVEKPTATGYMRVWPADTAQPNVTALNFVANKNISNSTTVNISPDGFVQLSNNSAGKTRVFLDVVGFYTDVVPGYEGAQSGRFMPVTPRRLTDTRSNKYPLKPAETRVLYGAADMNNGTYNQDVKSTTEAAVMSVTVIKPTAGGNITIWPEGEPRPVSTNLSFSAGQTISNQAIVQIPSSGRLQMYNSAGTSDIVIDQVGLVMKDLDEVSVSQYTYAEGSSQNYNSTSSTPGLEYSVVFDSIPAKLSGGAETRLNFSSYLYNGSVSISSNTPTISFKDGKSSLSFGFNSTSTATYVSLFPGAVTSTPYSGRTEVVVPYDIAVGKSYKFVTEITADEPGYTGKWQTSSVTGPNGAKIPLLKNYIGASGSTYGYSTPQLNASSGYTSCSDPNTLSFAIKDIKINNQIYDPRLSTASLNNNQSGGFCPGFSSHKINRAGQGPGVFVGTIGVPKSLRDVTKPVIGSTVQKAKTYEVTTSDNIAIDDITLEVNGILVPRVVAWETSYEYGSYTTTRNVTNAFIGDANSTISFDLKDYSAGQYEARVVATDLSGNKQEKVQTITIP